MSDDIVLILGKGVNLTRFLFFGPKNGSKNTQKSTNEMQCDIKCYWIILKEQNSAGERIAVFHVISKLFFQDDWTSTILLFLACNIGFFFVELFLSIEKIGIVEKSKPKFDCFFSGFALFYNKEKKLYWSINESIMR